MKITDEIVEAFCRARYGTSWALLQEAAHADERRDVRAALESVAERIVAEAEREAWRPGSDGSSLNPDEHVLVEFGTRPDIVIGHWSESAALEMDGNGWLGDGGCWLSDVRRFRPLLVPPAAGTER